MAQAASAVPAPTDVSVDDLYSALQAADKAGNSADAQQIAQMIHARQTAAPAAETTGTGTGTPQITNPLLRYPLQAGSALIKGTAGVLDLPRTISSALDIPLTAGMNLLTGQNLSTPSEFVRKNAPLRVPAAGEITNALGVTDNPRLAPQGLTENLLTGGISAAPYAALDIASGGAAIPALATATASGTAAEAAHQYDPDSILTPIIAGMLGGYGVGSVDRMIGNFGKVKAARKALDSAHSALEDFKDQLPTARFDLGQSFDKAKKLAVDNFSAFKDAAIAERDAVADGVSSTIKGIAQKLSPAADLEEAGGHLQAAARDWLGKTLPGKVSALWKPLDNAIPTDAPVDLKGFNSALDAINKSAGGLEPVAKLMKPRLPAQIQSTLQAIGEKNELAGAAGKPFVWGDVAKLRTTLGDAMSDPVVLKDVGQQNLSRLYATLTSDMRSTAAAHGAADAFDAANQGSAALFQTAEGPIAKLVSGKMTDKSADPLPGAVAAALLRTGGRDSSDLQVLRDELGPALDHLGAVALNSGAWSKLHPGSQEALLPDQAARDTIGSALQSKSAADEAMTQALAGAKQAHQNNLDIADLARKQGNLQLTNSMRSLAKAKSAAKENLSSMTEDRAAGLQHGIGGLFGTAAGGELGILGLNALGLPGSDIVHGAIGSTIGMMAPAVARATRRGVKTAVNDPASLKYPALGATVGSAWQPQLEDGSRRNALTGQ